MVHVDLVHAFLPEEGEGGNLAGVVRDAEELTPERMQEVAAKVGASETAFVLPPKAAGDTRLRFFTPDTEVPLCGHATLAAVHALAEAGAVSTGGDLDRLKVETGAGAVQVDVLRSDGDIRRINMTQARPEVVVPRVMVGEVAPHLGVPRKAIEAAGAPIQVVSTGLRHLIVPVEDQAAVAAIAPKESLKKFLEAKNVHTLHAYALVRRRPDVRVVQRDFAPHIGVPEDAATGTATGAHAAYLVLNHLVPATPPVFTIHHEQGAEMGQPSLLIADVHGEPAMGGMRATKVKVGGRCKVTGEMDL